MEDDLLETENKKSELQKQTNASLNVIIIILAHEVYRRIECKRIEGFAAVHEVDRMTLL